MSNDTITTGFERVEQVLALKKAWQDQLSSAQYFESKMAADLLGALLPLVEGYPEIAERVQAEYCLTGEACRSLFETAKLTELINEVL